MRIPLIPQIRNGFVCPRALRWRRLITGVDVSQDALISPLDVIAWAHPSREPRRSKSIWCMWVFSTMLEQVIVTAHTDAPAIAQVNLQFWR